MAISDSRRWPLWNLSCLEMKVSNVTIHTLGPCGDQKQTGRPVNPANPFFGIFFGQRKPKRQGKFHFCLEFSNTKEIKLIAATEYFLFPLTPTSQRLEPQAISCLKYLY